jgi:spore maturation protein CgeB
VTFVGGVNPKVHPERITVLERVAREVELEVWGYGANALPKRSILRRCHRGEAWAIGMYEVLARSRITLNVHIEAAETYANNMRLYEGTGTGALLLTDRKQNLGDLFELGREVVAYDDADDLVEKIRHYLDDDRARAEIAAAGQARTLREHTYQRRVGELVDLLASAAGATPTRIGSGG